MLQYHIDRDSPLPAYYQIALDLRQRIASGEWRAGSQLPAEPELARQYDVSRMTVRQAMTELAKDGILVRRRGTGTFVNQGFLDVMAPEIEPLPLASTGNPEKVQLRQQVWAELRRVARPDSRFHWNFAEFVPDFEGSEHCASAIRRLDVYRDARMLFVAPDNSLQQVRANAIADGKQLLVATHAMVRGFYRLIPDQIPESEIPFAATLDGMERYGRSVSLSEIRELGNIQLLVTGISVVTEKGVRWGKGHGYFDLEWGMFREIGVVNEETPVIAVGHDCQVVALDLEPSPVDTIADLVVTPTRLLTVTPSYPKPGGILWAYISPELRRQMPPLQALYEEQNEQPDVIQEVGK